MEHGPLEEKYSNLAGSHPVERAVQKARRQGESIPDKKPDRIDAYLQRLEGLVEDERGWELLKHKVVHDLTIDTDNEELMLKLAHGLYASEKCMAIEQGRGADIKQLENDHDVISQYHTLIHEKADIQEASLNSWLEYLHANDAQYPFWFRYFVVRGLGGMGTLDKEHQRYTKRTDRTVAPFPELNAEALGFVYRALVSGIPETETATWSDESLERLQKAIASKDFTKLYALAQVETAGQLNKESIEGEWVKYDQGTDYHVLEDALRGKGTGWCTAEGSAQAHLSGGDFYVYYTKNPDSAFTEPRIAIRMEGAVLGEVRGVNPRQELEPELLEIAQEKYQSLPGGETYDKKTADMKEMTRLIEKHERGEDFTKEELRFLYEIDSTIESFGYGEDPRIKELKQGRDLRADYATMYAVPESAVALTYDEIVPGETKVYGGDSEYDPYTPDPAVSSDELALIEIIEGKVETDITKVSQEAKASITKWRGSITDKATSIHYPQLQSVRGGLVAASASTFEVPQLQSVGGHLYVNSADIFEAPQLQLVGGHLDTSRATSFEAPQLQSVGGHLDASDATSFVAPQLQKVGGWFNANSADTFEAPQLQSVGTTLSADSATAFEAPQLQSVGETLSADSATAFEAPQLQSVGNDLYADSATAFEAPQLQSVGRDLFASSATAFEAPQLQSVGGDIDASDATSFVAPQLQSVREGLNASSASTFEVPQLQSVGGLLLIREEVADTVPKSVRNSIKIVS
jgi:hypothetical protein